MIIASRPADLLPSTGFWYEMAHADLFDLRISDPIHPLGPQRRVRMRGSWTTIPVMGGTPGSPISEARILPTEAPRALTALITERYRDAKHWKRRSAQVLDIVNGVHTDSLWQFNLHLILGIRGLLDITTPVSIGRRPMAPGGAGVAAILADYRASTFLSGTAGRAYVGGDESYLASGIQIMWSSHKPVTADSILTVLLDHDDPRAVVMAEASTSRGTRPATGTGLAP